MSERVLLVEDDPTLGASLEGRLAAAGYDVRRVTTGGAGLDALPAFRPDVVLLDLMLPDYGGLFVLERIRKVSRVPVIILTARHSGEDKVRGLDLGADDYVVKPFWDEELLARVRAQLRRTRPEPDRALRFGEVVIDPSARRVSVAGEERPLSPTEYDLLVYLLERAGRSLRAEQIVAEVLTGEDATRQALQTHISRLRRKLGDDGARIATVWGIGYRLDP